MRYSQPVSTFSVIIKWGLVIVAVGVIGGMGFWLMDEQAKRPPRLHELPTPAPIQTLATPDSVKPIKPEYDEPAPVPVPQRLPDIDQSDASILAAIKGLNINGLLEMIVPQDILRKFVRAVDVLEDGKIVTEYRPIASPQGAFVADSFTVRVSGGELGEQQEVEQFRISPKNHLRYTLFVETVSALDSDAAINLYKRYYPLFSRAHQELGSGKGNFHSVLIRAIDKMLTAPDIGGEVLLIHPKVYYEFADPALERLPEAHKLMLRMGPDNTARVKAGLRNIRARLLQK